MRALEADHPAQDHLRAAIARIEREWNEGDMLARPTVEDYAAVRANADAWLAHFQRAEEEALQRGEDPGDPDTLATLIAEADRLTDPVPRVGPHPIIVFLGTPWGKLVLYGGILLLVVVIWTAVARAVRAQVARS